MAGVALTAVQRKAMEFLWFKYGNGGNCHTVANHKFFQRHIEQKPEEAQKYAHLITAECKEAFDRVMQGDFREFNESARQVLTGIEKGVM